MPEGVTAWAGASANCSAIVVLQYYRAYLLLRPVRSRKHLPASARPDVLGERRMADRLRRLESAGGAQDLGISIERADDLQADRQSAGGQAAGNARRRLAGHVERVAERRPV